METQKPPQCAGLVIECSRGEKILRSQEIKCHEKMDKKV
jgi:hypothetical protein